MPTQKYFTFKTSSIQIWTNYPSIFWWKAKDLKPTFHSTTIVTTFKIMINRNTNPQFNYQGNTTTTQKTEYKFTILLFQMY